MNVYVFADIEQLTNNYHSGGGLVVIASDKDDVDRQLVNHPNVFIAEAEWDAVITYPTADNAEPAVYIFPDAGCC